MNAPDLARNRSACSVGAFRHRPEPPEWQTSSLPGLRGKRPFRFDDKDGRGTPCSHCRAGDGFRLLELVKGWSFKEAAD